MFLLDTNVLSELRRPWRTHPKVAAWSSGVLPADLYLSAITILEIETGALLMAGRDRAQGALLRNWIDRQVLPTLLAARCLWTPPWRGAVRISTCQTHAPNAMHSSPPPRKCTACALSPAT